MTFHLTPGGVCESLHNELVCALMSYRFGLLFYAKTLYKQQEQYVCNVKETMLK